MVKALIVIVLIVVILIVVFNHLIQQSKEPRGFIGSFMMKLWNRVYIPLVKWTIVDLNNINDDMKILDVGVGNGQSTKLLSEQFPNSEIYGIDISDKAIEDARKMNSRVIYQVKNVMKTGYKENYFDFIFAFQTHFYWDDLEDSLI